MRPECVFLRVGAPEGQEAHHLEGCDEGSCRKGEVLRAQSQGELRLCFRCKSSSLGGKCSTERS